MSKLATKTQLKLLAQRVNSFLVLFSQSKQNKLAGHMATSSTMVVTCDANGNIYYRTAEEFLNDIGAVTQTQMNTAIQNALAGVQGVSFGTTATGTEIMNGTYDYG